MLTDLIVHDCMCIIFFFPHQAFAREGAKVIAADINMEKLSELKGVSGMWWYHLALYKTYLTIVLF